MFCMYKNIINIQNQQYLNLDTVNTSNYISQNSSQNMWITAMTSIFCVGIVSTKGLYFLYEQNYYKYTQSIIFKFRYYETHRIIFHIIVIVHKICGSLQ